MSQKILYDKGEFTVIGFHDQRIEITRRFTMDRWVFPEAQTIEIPTWLLLFIGQEYQRHYRFRIPIHPIDWKGMYGHDNKGTSPSTSEGS